MGRGVRRSESVHRIDVPHHFHVNIRSAFLDLGQESLVLASKVWHPEVDLLEFFHVLQSSQTVIVKLVVPDLDRCQVAMGAQRSNPRSGNARKE